MKLHFPALAAVALTIGAALPAGAAFTDVNLAGWQAVGDFGAAGNTELVVNVGINSLITGFGYTGLSFTTSGDSWLSEFVISVNNTGATEWLDWSPSTTNAGGTFGPASGFFDGDTGTGGPYGAGEAFTVADGQIRITTYLSYDIGSVGAAVQSGSLRVYYDPAPIPEPASYAMMALGLAGVAVLLRRRRP